MVRYLPKYLSRKDKKTQKRELQKSQRMYKKGIYYTRKKIKSFKPKKSNHIMNAQKLYNVDIIGATPELVKKTHCSKQSLEKIINKGQGAYFSSGSRPNQTGQSWGIARLASAITGGKSALVDYSILENGCDHKKSKAFILAKQLKKRIPILRHSYKNK